MERYFSARRILMRAEMIQASETVVMVVIDFQVKGHVERGGGGAQLHCTYIGVFCPPTPLSTHNAHKSGAKKFDIPATTNPTSSKRASRHRPPSSSSPLASPQPHFPLRDTIHREISAQYERLSQGRAVPDGASRGTGKLSAKKLAPPCSPAPSPGEDWMVDPPSIGDLQGR
jgi:hypothetical protein